MGHSLVHMLSETQRILARLSQNDKVCSVGSYTKYMWCLLTLPVSSPNLTSIAENGQYQTAEKIATLFGVRNV